LVVLPEGTHRLAQGGQQCPQFDHRLGLDRLERRPGDGRDQFVHVGVFAGRLDVSKRRGVDNRCLSGLQIGLRLSRRRRVGRSRGQHVLSRSSHWLDRLGEQHAHRCLLRGVRHLGASRARRRLETQLQVVEGEPRERRDGFGLVKFRRVFHEGVIGRFGAFLERFPTQPHAALRR
jgi:hypothetical protein